MMQKLLDYNDGNVISRGFHPSIASNQQELWRTGKNVEFGKISAVKAKGQNIVKLTSGNVLSLQQANVEGVLRAYWAEAANVYKYEDSVSTEIGSGLTNGGGVSLETWGSWLLLANNVDPVKVYKNTGSMVDLADVRRATARLIKKHKNHVLIYFDQSVDWSSDSNPELWEPDVDNSAGGQLIRDLDSDIIAACQLGEAFAVYSGDKLVIQRYIGEPFFFSFSPGADGAGAVSDSGIIAVSNFNFGMSKKGFFRTDGISVDPIDTPKINKFVMSRFVSTEGYKVVGLHDERNELVKWWFPCVDNITRGVSFNYKTGSWGILEQEIYCAASQEVFDLPIVGGEASWGFLNSANNADVALPAEITTFPLDAGKRERYKLWNMVRVNFSGNGLEIRFGFQDELQDDTGEEISPSWTSWTPIKKENYIDREAVFMTISIRSIAFNTSWEITGMSVHGEISGNL